MKAKSVQQSPLENRATSRHPKAIKGKELGVKPEGLTPADSKELSTDTLKKESSEGASSSSVKDAISKATSVAKEAIKKPTSVPIPIAEKLTDLKKGKSIDKSEPTLLKKPGIFFIGGMGLFSGGYGGIKEMSDSLPGADHFHWDEKSKIIEEIKKRPVGEPIILVGHSFGGDSAIEIAKDLNTLPNGFRKVDLLVTLDAVGWNHDVIPPNVVSHQNFISESDFFFNGSPHIAKDSEMTAVMNELRPEKHTDLDNSTAIQFKIFRAVENVLGDRYSSTVSKEISS